MFQSYKKNFSKKIFLFFNLILVVVILSLNTLAQFYAWYWRYGWFDVLMHSLGGLFSSSFSLYLYYYSGYIKPYHRSFLFMFAIGVAASLSVGVVWEFFEFILDRFVKPAGSSLLQVNVEDTMSDLFFDFVGGVIGITCYRLIWHRRSLR